MYWWAHNSKLGQYSSAKVHRSLMIKRREEVQLAQSIEDYEITVQPLEGLDVQEYAGL